MLVFVFWVSPPFLNDKFTLFELCEMICVIKLHISAKFKRKRSRFKAEFYNISNTEVLVLKGKFQTGLLDI